MSGLKLQQLTVGPLEENCWLVTNPEAKSSVLVDPGDDADTLLAAVAATGSALVGIWLTHGHFDHVGAIADIIAVQSVPIWLHPADRFLYEHAQEAAAKWGIAVKSPPPYQHELAEHDVLLLGAYEFNVVHLPGHSPGHVAFIGHGVCLSGDVLFAGSIGRTDLPLSDPTAMHASLARMSALPPETRVLPGHGPATSIERELVSNPFLRGAARPIGA